MLVRLEKNSTFLRPITCSTLVTLQLGLRNADAYIVPVADRIVLSLRELHLKIYHSRRFIPWIKFVFLFSHHMKYLNHLIYNVIA